MGKRLLDQALSELAFDYNLLPSSAVTNLLKSLELETEDDLFCAIGVGDQIPMLMAKRLVVDQTPTDSDMNAVKKPLAIKGTEGMVVHFAECCQPIPGDIIVGVSQQGLGLIVHANDCHLLKKTKITNSEHFLALCWDEHVQGEYWVDIIVDVINQRGVLGMLATTISSAESNIGNISVDPRDGRHNTIAFSITVHDRAHLARVMRRLRANQVVNRLYRKKQGD